MASADVTSIGKPGDSMIADNRGRRSAARGSSGRARIVNAAIAVGLFVLLLAFAPSRLLHSTPWIGLFTALVFLLSQPAPDPKEMVSARNADRRSALAIFVAMIGAQLIAVIDFGFGPAGPRGTSSVFLTPYWVQSISWAAVDARERIDALTARRRTRRLVPFVV